MSFEVEELTLRLPGKAVRINRASVISAFDKAGFGEFMGPSARFYIALEKELKSAVSVYRELTGMVDVPTDEISIEKIADIFRVLGFTVLDRRERRE